MRHILTIKEYKNMANEYDKVKYKCKCGHRVVIPYNVDKQICSYCKKYVFKDKQREFEYRLREKIKWV